MSRKKKINILMISSSSSLGGGTNHMFMLGQNLSNEFKVFYAIPKNQNFKKLLDSNSHVAISERKFNLIDILKLMIFFKSKSIDIIHAHGKGAGVISRILRILINKPLIYTFHGIHLKCHRWHKRLIYILYEYLTGWIDSYKILVSKSEKNYAKKFKIYLGKKSMVINNGVLNKPRKTNYNLVEEGLNVLNVISVCRFVEQKNVHEILKIAFKLSNFNFCIIGNGPLWQDINRSIRTNNLKNVILLGEKKDIFKYLYDSDVYLSTSLYEGLPISILEAMSIGLPIVASNVIGNCDTIENGKSGYLYQLNDINTLECYLISLAENVNLRKKIGNEAFKRQRKIFSHKSMISKYIDLYKNQIE